MVWPLWKIVGQFPKVFNIDFPYDLAILLLNIYPREMKAYVYTKTYTMFIAPLS